MKRSEKALYQEYRNYQILYCKTLIKEGTRAANRYFKKMNEVKAKIPNFIADLVPIGGAK